MCGNNYENIIKGSFKKIKWKAEVFCHAGWGLGCRMGGVMADKEISNKGEQGIQVRPALQADVVFIHALISDLADFESLQHQFVASVADLEQGLIGVDRAAEALVAEVEGQVVAYAIFFPSYSTFIGKAGLWLEDLYVKPEFRGRGVGKALITAVAGLAEQRGCQRFEWSVLDWNQRAIDFYQSLGADVMPDWRTARLDREGIETLAGCEGEGD